VIFNQPLLTRLIQGDRRHKTRFHDFEGNKARGGLLQSLLSATCLKLGHRQQLPWINYPAMERLRAILTREFKVLEFGSGLSTLWLSQRCALVVTIENDPDWFAVVQSEAGENVDARLCTEPEEYCRVSGYSERYFDLVIVDGRWRDRATRKALQMVPSGGHIYLDNSDVQDTEHQEAKSLLLNASRSAELLVGLSPFQVTTTQGIFARL
jgi:predicted O-methyltransferase YrrM